jgi:glycoprotein-N-acetylgalactosamine 3-beta-galactosyltransferase
MIVAAMVMILEVVQKVSTLNQLLEIGDQRAAAESSSHAWTPVQTLNPLHHHNNTNTASSNYDTSLSTRATTQSNIPDVTFLSRQRQQRPPSDESSCQTPPAQGPEGKMGFQALTKIQISGTKEANIKIMCIVITNSTQHDTTLKAIVDTYAPLCDGFLAASNLTDESLGAVKLFSNEHSEWERVLRTWSYVHQHYRSSFGAFHLGEDDMYVIPENLRQMVSNYDSFRKQPLYLGGAIVPSRKTPEIRYCGGGAGYTLNLKALDVVAARLDQCTLSSKKQLPVDQQMGQCLDQVANLQCGKTADAKSSLRYLEFGIDYQAKWSIKVNGPIKVRPLLEHHDIYICQGIPGIAPDAISIHLVNGAWPLAIFSQLKPFNASIPFFKIIVRVNGNNQQCLWMWMVTPVRP